MLLFVTLSAVAAFHGFAIPVLLFFLPWSTIIKMAPGGISFYTIALLVVCAIAFFRQGFKFNVRCMLVGLLITFVSLLSKLMDGSSIALSYLMFIFLLMLLPNTTQEIGKFSDFKTLTLFFSFGIITAALSAQQLADIPTIAKYIDVYNYNILTRLSGYYGDANFYSAHISAAIAGVLMLILCEKNKRSSFLLMILSVVLLYCGFMSASKAFAITMMLVFVLWFIAVFSLKGRQSFKAYIIFIAIVTIIFVFTSGIFKEFIDMIAFRFGQSNNAYEFTTGRTERWADYIKVILSDAKILLVGKGFNNINLNDMGSHNTLLQIIYQFGLIGGIALYAWLVAFVKLILKNKKRAVPVCFTLVILIGAFLPWLSIDLLFFDEFFLMPIYICAGILYFSKNQLILGED